MVIAMGKRCRRILVAKIEESGEDVSGQTAKLGEKKTGAGPDNTCVHDLYHQNKNLFKSFFQLLTFVFYTLGRQRCLTGCVTSNIQ